MPQSEDRFEELLLAGEYEQALAGAEAAAEAARAAGEPAAEARALLQQGEALRMLDRNAEGLARAEQAERLAQGAPEAGWERVDALRVQADNLRMLEQTEEALRRAQQAETLAAQGGYVRGEVDALRPQAHTLLRLDRNEESLAAAQRAARLAGQAGYTWGEANALDAQADTLLKLEQREESLACAQRAAKLYRQAGDRLREANALSSVSNALREMDRSEEALAQGEAAEEGYRQLGDRLGQGNALRSQAESLHKLGRDEEALARAEAGQARAHEVGSRHGEADALRVQAEALTRLGRYAEAIERAREGEGLFRQTGSRQGMAECALAAALAAQEQGDRAQARAAAERAGQLYQEAGMGTMARYAQYVARAAEEPPSQEAGGRAVARLHEEFGAQLGEILTSAEQTEEAWHRELNRPRQAPCAAGTGELVILRQWPSYATLSLLPYPDEVAGGYLLRWGGRNLVIDPGMGFLAALRRGGFHLRDLDGVVVTHWHIDHTGDVEELLTSVFEANEDELLTQLDFFLAPGAFGVYANLLAHNPGVRSVTLLRAGEVDRWGDIELAGVAAGHRDLTGREGGAIGLRVTLLDPEGQPAVALGLTSDTRWSPGLVEAFRGVDLLVLHLGGIYGRDLQPDEYAKNHLGVKGTAELLSALAAGGQAPRLALVSEIGKELEYERVKLCGILGEVCGCAVCPAELGLALSLPSLEPRCDARGCEQPARRWGLDPHDRRVICFRCEECPAPLDSRPLPAG